MFFIVLNHCILNVASKTVFLNTCVGNFLLIDILYQIVYIGVNLFILISGYFLVVGVRDTTNWEKVFRLWITTFFYSLFLYLFIVGIHWESFDVYDFIHVLMPIRYDSYWFITQYLGLYIMSPFLAKWARMISKREYEIMLFSFFIITSIIQLPGLKGGFSLIWFIFLFIFAGYIRLYGNESPLLSKWKLNSGVIFTIFIFVLSFIAVISNGKMLGIVEYWGFYNGPFLFIVSVSFFFLFLKLKEFRLVVFISKFSPYMFGVYLIHENPTLKKILWPYLSEQFPRIGIYQLFLIAFIVLSICVLIEWIRQRIFIVLKIETHLFRCVKFVFDYVSLLLRGRGCLNL